MLWEKALCDAYDACEKFIDYEHNDGNGLCPIAHQPLNVQIDIVISEQSEFIRASRIDQITDENGKKRSVKIFAPADENACARSSGIAPKGISDDLRYVCGDFRKLFPKNPKAKKSDEAHKAYMEQMQSWIDFGAPDDVNILYRYLEKGTTAEDVIRCISDAAPEDVVRFTVIHKNDEIVKGMWQSKEIADSFAAFCISRKKCEGIDMITGKKKKLASVFPSQIRSGGDKAKLVSSNSIKKANDFTFKGSYCKTAFDCVSVGYEESQKMTNALRYLISKQGIINGSERIVCFQIHSGTLLPDLTDNLFFDDAKENEEENTAEMYAKRVKKAVNGIKKDLNAKENITVIGVDSAEGSETDLKGRLAITRYYEENQNAFLANVSRWYKTCRWKMGTRIFTPTPYRIACAAYGIQSGEKLTPRSVKIKRVKEAVMDCTLEGEKISLQIVTDVMESARNPQRYSEKSWRNIICVALAVLSRYCSDYKGEIIEMELNKEKHDRSYQFGRLLAVMERIEETVNRKRDVTRTTNAVKNWKSFTMTPASAFARIHDKTLPYMAQLSPGTQNAYKNKISEIIEKIEMTDGFTNEKLDDTYLAGYYLQRESMIREAIEAKAKKEENKQEKEEEE